MQLFCAKCQTQFPATSRCPRCSSRLLSAGEAAESLAKSAEPPPRGMQTTLMGRVLVGSVLALGLHWALREWVAAAGAFDDSISTAGFISGYFLRLIAAGIGGLFSGAGRNLAFSGGACVGLLSGFGWLIVDPYPDWTLDAVHAGLMLIIVTVGGGFALVGGRIWPALVELPEIESPRRSSLLKLVTGGKKPLLTRPTRWGKILVSALAVLLAVLAADAGLNLLKKIPHKILNLGGPSSAPFLDFQIALAGVVLTGVFVGAATGAGFRHGASTGLIAAGAVALAFAQQPAGSFPAVEYLIDKLEARESEARGLSALAGGVFAAVAVSGWVGGQLFPPLKQRRRGRRNE